MRNIGTLPSDDEATRFSAALYLHGIESDVEAEDDGTFSIWVHDDAQLAPARGLLEKFRADPRAEEFNKAPTTASRARAEAAKAEQARGSNVITRERLEYERTYQKPTWLPLIMIFACVAVAIQSDTMLNDTPKNLDWLRWLFFSSGRGLLDLGEIRHGEVWRLITPIFIHFGPMHLLFNMMWLRDLGTFTENRFGTAYFAALVLVIAIASNVAQNAVAGPVFGGMSGVNYGLFGFLWMRGKFDRFAAWRLNPLLIQTMLFWFFLCFTPLVPHVANGAHFAGLAMGMAWGYVSAKLATGRRP